MVEHREFITDVAGSVAFTATDFAVNPGLGSTFPWLSTIARRFESYSFEKLDFVFETQAPTSATGGVFLVMDYDSADPAPADKVSAMSYRHAVRGPPWVTEPLVNRSLPEDLHKMKSNFVRSAVALAANLDIKLYDVANFFMCTQGQAGTTAVGELYVSYKVRLMTPQLNADAIPVWRAAVTAGSASGAIFGSARTLYAGNNIDLTVDSASQITFNQAFEGIVTVGYSASQGSITTVTAGAGTATATVLNQTISVTTAQGVSVMWTVSATAGQTFAPGITLGAASGANVIRIMAYPVAAL